MPSLVHRLAAFAAAVALVTGPAAAQTIVGGTIVDQWSSVPVPTAPPLRRVTVDPRTTALLMLDFMRQNCGSRPSCLASLTSVAKLLESARNAGAPVIYSIINGSTTADVLPPVAPRPNEPFVQAGPDKFLGTELESLLRQRGVKTVIVVGTAAQGAVLTTASGAALRGFDAVVPLDGVSGDLYAEQYTAWHLANLPGAAPRVTLSRTDAVTFSRS